LKPLIQKNLEIEEVPILFAEGVIEVTVFSSSAFFFQPKCSTIKCQCYRKPALPMFLDKNLFFKPASVKLKK
jgi:hypothetical protein